MVTDRSVVLDGVELRISEAGRGGRPLLLVHGFTGVRSDFTEWFDRLAERGWHAVAPDLRGHGDSDQPADEAAYSLQLFADDVLALVDDLGWDRFVLLGHSMGGMIVEEVVLRAPERVAALVLMDTSHRNVDVDPELAALGAKIAREEGLEVLVELEREIENPLETQAYRDYIAARPEHATRSEDNTRGSSAAMYAAMITEIVQRPDRLGELGDLPMPTLVIVGEQDTPFLAQSEAMAATIPDAQLAVIPGGGHSPQFEAADAWWSAFSGFLDDVAAPAYDRGQQR